MAHVYTLKHNAARAAKKAGLDPKTCVQAVEGGFVVAPPAPEPKPKPEPRRAQADYPRAGSKNATLLNMLTREGGATAAQLEATLGWKPATVRCALQRVTKAYRFVWRYVKGEGEHKARWEASRA